ncbi:Bug family tripartite tricarboxylate transporter substrate binding protein [Aquibium microcysteis]|uniref:Bug family tripartite tricarboxylate transporter substrate binding protein n=1 Tax=Aquibium microcysteis TaxID=675281 RepID=UPI00165D2038|nr:tripartite tricarboxylate transporter substrate binding protein [Aquibium microcysteis]
MSNEHLKITRRTALTLALGATALMAPGLAFAQSGYPSKTISFICAFPAGSGADVLVRFFADKVAAVSGHTVIVENKPGAAGSIATEFTARAPADGHTIFVHSGNSVAGNMWLMKKPPVDAAKDLQTIATVNKQAFMITVRADSPYKTLADLVADQKAKGDKGSYAVNATSGRVLAEEFKQIAGLQTVPVSYGTAADSINDIMSGQVDFGVQDPVFSLAQVRGGRFRVLALGAAERLQGIPDIPTFKEQGYDIDQLGWWGVMVPAGVPADVVTTINGWFNQVLADEATKEFLMKQGGDPYVSTPEEAQKLMEDTITEWKRLVEVAKIPAQ